MILYAPGDVWAWNVAVRYADAGGILLDDRERWTVRIEKGGALAVERAFLGTMLGDGALVPSADPKPEVLKGRIEPDGTLSLKDTASDPVAARVLRRLLNPDRGITERLAGTPLVRHAVIQDKEAFVPGSGLPASLRVEANLFSAHLGGKEIPLTPTPLPQKGNHL